MRFEKNSKRTRELGSKGGKALHPNGPTAGDEATYRYRKFTITWTKTKHCWKAVSDNKKTTLYARSIAEIKRDINQDRADHPDDYITLKPEI